MNLDLQGGRAGVMVKCSVGFSPLFRLSMSSYPSDL
jgi:hypothetical protein